MDFQNHEKSSENEISEYSKNIFSGELLHSDLIPILQNQTNQGSFPDVFYISSFLKPFFLQFPATGLTWLPQIWQRLQLTVKGGAGYLEQCHQYIFQQWFLLDI